MTHDSATVTRIEVRRDTGRIGVQPEGNVKPFPPPRASTIERPTSHAHAAATMEPTPYLAYCLTQACKLLIKLVEKKWPEAA